MTPPDYRPGTKVHVAYEGRRRAATVTKAPGYKPPAGTALVQWDPGEGPGTEKRTLVATSKIVGER